MYYSLSEDGLLISIKLSNVHSFGLKMPLSGIHPREMLGPERSGGCSTVCSFEGLEGRAWASTAGRVLRKGRCAHPMHPHGHWVSTSVFKGWFGCMFLTWKASLDKLVREKSGYRMACSV